MRTKTQSQEMAQPERVAGRVAERVIARVANRNYEVQTQGVRTFWKKILRRRGARGSEAIELRAEAATLGFKY